MTRATVCRRAGSKLLPMRTVWLFGLLAACTASASEVQPKPDTLFFPTGLAVAPNDGLMFVANANSDLTFDSGSITVIDLGQVDAIAGGWTGTQAIPNGCSQDVDHTETLVCDLSNFVLAGAGARIGNFATDIAVQDTGNGRLRLIVPTRGDPSIAWVDWDGSHLSCNPGAEGFALCDEAHRLAYVHNDPNLALLPNEPFAAFADSFGEFAMVSHLTSGAVTLIDSPANGAATIADVAQNLFQADPLTGLRGATGVAGRTPGSPGDIVYVGSRSEARIQTFTVARPVNGVDPFLIPGDWFFLDIVGANSGASTDTRALQFSPGGDRMYVINRRPASLQIFDTSLGPTGFPANKGVAATDVCRQASTLTVMDSGAGERAYVTCFQDGEVYVVDPRGGASVEAIVSVGRGPFAVAAAPTRKKIYVTNFLENTVAVIDTSPTSPTYNRVILRVGIPKPPS